MKKKLFTFFSNPRKTSVLGTVLGTTFGFNLGLDALIDHTINYGDMRLYELSYRPVIDHSINYGDERPYEYFDKPVYIDPHVRPRMSDVVTPTIVWAVLGGVAGFFAGRNVAAKQLLRALPENKPKGMSL